VSHRRLIAAALILFGAYQPLVHAGAEQVFHSPLDVYDEPVATPAPTPVPTAVETDAPVVAVVESPSPAPAASETPEPVVIPKSVIVPPPGGADAPVAGTSARGSDHAGYSYSYAVDDRRFNDTTISTDTYKPLGDSTSRFRPYVALFVDKDSRTTPGTPSGGGPAIPLIYSDNYGVVAAGVQYTTPQGLRVFLQGGASQTVGPVAAIPSGGDLRGGVQLYREWGPQYAAGRTYGNFYGSGSYLSRYSDSIFYNQLEIVHNLGTARNPLEPFLRAVYSTDTRDFYYSNTAELTAGLRWHPLGVHGPILSLDGVTGRYLRGPLPVTTPRSYTDLRPTISFGFSL
jgi:hypothetical protein